ncbi:MAG: MBL fold metallo-hydrolase, partial [Myxococcales bacterium]
MHCSLAAAAALLLVPALAAAQQKAPTGTQATWWGHAAWVIQTPGGARIALDPWLENPSAPKGAAQPDALDAILVSHAHFDHVGNTVALAKKTGAQVFGSFELAALLGVEKAVGGNVGGSFRVKDVTIHMVEAVHSS